MTKARIRKQKGGQPSRRAVQLREDRWVNERNHFGGARDPISRTTFFRDLMVTREFLDSLFRYDWLSRRAIEIPAQDATRKWITIKDQSQTRVQAIERECERLQVQSKFKELITLSRLYGGAILVAGAWDGRDPGMPLGNIREVRWLSNVDRYLAYPMSFYTDKEKSEYGETERYQITRPTMIGSDVAYVHETRVIRMDGLYLPPMERLRNFTFGASVIENILEATRQFGVCTQGLAGVIQDFIVKKLKVSNLQDLLQTDDGADKLMTRLGELAAGISIHQIAIFGEDEEFDKMGTPVTGLTDIADRFVEYASAATGIPRSRLFNNLSGRLGGDAGENDLRVHYDTIESMQKNDLRPKLQRLLDFVVAPMGIEAGELEWEFNPLWQMSDAEQADVRLKVAQTDQIYIVTGTVEPEEVALTRFGGDGIDLNDMVIERKPREAFLKEFAKADMTPSREASAAATEALTDPPEAGAEGGGDGNGTNGTKPKEKDKGEDASTSH
jgi:phage-related protein (TIGR01555 family)